MVKFHYSLFLILFLLSCQNETNDFTGQEQTKPAEISVDPFEKESIEHTQGPTTLSPTTFGEVTIEASFQNGGSLRWIGLCRDNDVSVIIRNGSDSVINIFQNWNSWGYYNFHFEIETDDSLYIVKRTKNTWWKNFPSYHSINPGQSLVFNFNLKDSSCVEHDEKIERVKGLTMWTGMPKKEYNHARLKVVYELPESEKYNNWLKIGRGGRDFSKDSLNSEENLGIVMFTGRLVSPAVDIKILK